MKKQKKKHINKQPMMFHLITLLDFQT